MNYCVALSEGKNEILLSHLIRDDGQEDLCFALYAPSTGSKRLSGLIQQIILPNPEERVLYGNVSFKAEYLDRVIAIALRKGLGICFIHSHLFPGWQDMSEADINAEMMLVPRVRALTKLPLLGMTVGSDGIWSARFWEKTAPKVYRKEWAYAVKVIGKKLTLHFSEHLFPAPKNKVEFARTVSAWGESKQADITRLRVGIVGLGSVGSLIAEALMRTGVRSISLIDFDCIERRNLDRLYAMGENDIGRLKVFAYRDLLQQNALDDQYKIEAFPYSITEREGIQAALDCDILFSCVDRPWPRYVLNNLAYAGLIPVIDGGIDASMNIKGNNIDQARWKAHTIGLHRRCLKCLGQYNLTDVATDMDGSLDDPTYIQELPKDHFVKRGENVFAFSLNLAGMLLNQFLSLILQPKGVYLGPKEMDFITGNIDFDFPDECEDNCNLSSIEAVGDYQSYALIQEHKAAIKSRKKGLVFESLDQQFKIS